MRNILAFALFVLSLSAGAQNKFTVSGYITDEKSSETVIGATIYDTETKHGTITNVFGFYSITLNAGKHSLSFSYVGYVPQNKEFILSKDTVINIKLSENNELQEIEVTAKKEDAGVQSTGTGSMDIPVDIIKHTPSLLGETDVIKTLQLTPGVQQGIGGSAAFYVRGGGGDENLVLLDGAPVYKIDHLFGFFSVFTPEAVKRVTFYKSAFPARYNGRTSSVVDVRTKDGDMKKIHGSFAVGLLTSRINLEGPIVKDKTSFSVSARTTYFSAVTKPFMSEDSKFGYWFYDLNLKVNHKFSDKDRLFFSLYSGLDKYKDDYKDDEFEISIPYGKDYDNRPNYVHVPLDEKYGTKLNWSNFIPSLRWNHVFSSKLFANTTVNYNHYKMNMSSYDEESYKYDTLSYYGYNKSEYNSEIEDLGVIMDFDYMPSPNHTVKFGVNYLYHNFMPETTNSVIKNHENSVKTDTSASMKGKPAYANELSVYAEDDWKVCEKLNFNLGVSYTLFSLKNKNYGNFQPRVSLKFSPLNYLAFKASYSRMSQCVHLLTSAPISLPTDLWVPITDKIKPETADQISCGVYFTKLKSWEFSVEGYYKKLENVLEYKDGMSYLGFSGAWSNLVASGEGVSKGLEFLVQKTEGRTTGWVAYTLSKSDREFDRSSGVNDGKKFPFTYDRRHNINIVAAFKINEKIDIDMSWTFYTGACATVTQSKLQIVSPDGADYQVYTGYGYYGYYGYHGNASYVPTRNNYRLPCSHTLCAGISFHKQKKHCERIWNFSFYNLYNAMNPSFVYLKDYDDYGHELSEPKFKKITILPLIPSFTLTYKF
ncbi:MAG: TonB-dependent receptor [Bacteroidales bacterium]|nr:TonB-dependent receptor [Bacteroidales bacterium]